MTKTKRNDRYQVSKVGVTEGPKETSSAADYIKPWRGSSRASMDDEDSEDSEGEEGSSEELTKSDK